MIVKFIKSLGFAISGLKFALITESNLKIQTAIGVLVIMLGIYVGLERWEWSIIFICTAFVLVCELINTALENLCDHVTAKPDRQIKIVKDVSAAAVLLASISAAITGLIIFLPYLSRL